MRSNILDPIARRAASHAGVAASLAGIAMAVVGCSSAPKPTAQTQVQPGTAAVAAPVEAAPAMTTAPRLSQATTPRAYRADAAGHIYAHNRERIWTGKLPPLLHAIGVVQVDIDRLGQVKRISWMRAPSHAPEVVAEIERTVRAAAPYPIPARLGTVTWTDTWLWDRSGRFQIDSLTEGQL